MTWHPHVDVWILVTALSAGYAYALRRIGPRQVPAGLPVASRGQVTAFSFGVAAIWIAGDWPVHDLAEGSLYSVHMVQHMLITLVAPPLLLMGTPAWLARRLLRPAWVLRWVRRLSRPLVALLLFTAVVAVSHWRVAVELSVRSELFHFGAHAVL
ncbi:MAG TPA: cytochrome c oxidase assembly protein, partial [Actinomycetota bacterium]|nr:cytochrome c oxidase assembly protein [Actinomycetota bacterium]